MESIRNSNNTTCIEKWKFSKFIPILAATLFFANPSGVEAQNIWNQNRDKTEISTSTILDRLNQSLWVSLPDEYNQKVLDFVLNDTIMRTISATDYTENFIKNEMKKNRWISKENQILFIWSKIYAWISRKTLYDWLDDDNETRSGEYSKALKTIRNSYEEYKKWFKIYMETKSSEYRQQSAEYDRQSAETREKIVKWLNESLGLLKESYYSYKESSDDEYLKGLRENAKKLIPLCIKYGVDYKAILSPEIRGALGME